MSGNYGDIADAVDQAIDPSALAYAHGERVISWGEAAERTNRLARAFLNAASTGDRVAIYMRNQPAYLETSSACFKARLAPVNVNYRYVAEEVAHILADSQTTILVYDVEYQDIVRAVRERIPDIRLFVATGPDDAIAEFAQSYESLTGTGDGTPLGVERSPDDFLLLYTGGTTGTPKGVIWPHGALRAALLDYHRKAGGALESVEEIIRSIAAKGPAAPFLPASPLMHGTGFIYAMDSMTAGSAIVTLASPSFDPHELWAAVDRHRVGTIVIVGDAFAKPMLRALAEKPCYYDLSSVVAICSSGVMWSAESKRALLDHLPNAAMVDGFGSSEAMGLAVSVMTTGGDGSTGQFRINERCKVFGENGEEIPPGSGRAGLIAIGPPFSAGYHGDPQMTARTYREIGGVRYAVPGDMCMVEADGTLVLLGRGSTTINSAGEKIHPEEVEEVLKGHAAVEDALVVGVPDERFGSAVVAVVALLPFVCVPESELRDHVRSRLAAYKSPRRIFFATDIDMRGANGKPDYKAAMKLAVTALDREKASA